MELITGYAGEPHIYPGDDAALNKGILTADNVVLEVDEQFAHEIVYNNKIRVKSGAAILQGRLIRIRTNQYDELTIENGTQALIRHDIIVARYSYEDGIESAETVVIKGTPGESGTDPEVSTGNIDQGDTLCDMPLYRVVINGLNIESVTPLFKTIKTMDWLEKNVDAVIAQNKIFAQSLEGKAPVSHTHTRSQITDLSGASVNYANSAGKATSASQVDSEKVKVWSDSEGGNVSLTAPDGTRWEIDAYNGNLRIFNYGSGTPGIAITKAGQISDKAGNRLDNKSDKGHTHDDRYYTESEVNNLLGGKLNRTISGNRTTRCIQDLQNIKVITANAAGTNAVSGLDNYLIIHHALDIRDPSNMYCFTAGFVTGGQYKLAQISNKALSIATNTVGTVAVQGGDASFVKQVFIAIPQIGAAIL